MYSKFDVQNLVFIVMVCPAREGACKCFRQVMIILSQAPVEKI